MKRQTNKYRFAKRKLIKNQGECSWCGDVESLEYHHLLPASRHGELSHAILLCKSCHHQETGRQRNYHKAIGVDGYRMRKAIKRQPPHRTAVNKLINLLRR